jgi:signal transduction histidine kinase
MMKLGINLRLTALGLGLALMGLLIVLATLQSEQQAHQLRVHLNRVDLESFGIADDFRNALRDVNDRMRAYRTSGDAALWDGFLQATRRFKALIDRQGPRANTQPEKEILAELKAAYRDYLSSAQDIRSAIESSTGSAVASVDPSRLIEHSRRLADLGQNLFRAHYDSRNELLADANRTLTKLRFSILGLLGLLFAIAVALALSVYHQMIAPLQVKLVESQALAERNEKMAALGMLAAGVAHEIRNPLTAIKAALFIQQKKFPAGSPERNDVQLVEREILRLERIVNHFLQFARPAEPNLALIAADVPLREVEALLSAQLGKGGIRLLREPCPEMKINADVAQIQQVLINLIQNAADSIDGSGTITLRARPDRQRLAVGETDVVILEVADTGQGIAPDVEKRLFDPFFSTKENGTGLGLSIAARIVEKHNGALQYQTQLGRGTTFGIVLPQAQV